MSRLYLTTILFFTFFICTTPTVHAFTISKPATNNLGLVGHWTMDGTDTVWTSSTAGTVTDLSGNGNTGTLTNMNSSSAPTVGRVGQALKFDGSNDYVDTGSSSNLDDLPRMTVSLWVNLERLGNPASGVAFLVDKETNASGGAGWYVSHSTSNSKLGFAALYSTTNLSVETELSSLTSSDLNRWMHVVVTWDGTNSASGVHIYRDGVEMSYSIQTDGVGTYKSDASQSLRIGSGTSSNRQTKGSLDDVRMYNRVLSSQEIKALYSAGASKFSTSKTSVTDGLVGHWTMDGKDTVWTSSTAGTVVDKSGNGNTGTLIDMNATRATAAGKSGQALFFDGVDDRVSVGDMTVIENASQASFAFWVKPETLNTSAIYLAKYNNNNSSISFRISESNSGCGGDSDDIVMYTGSSGVCSRTNLNFLTPGKWSHIVYVYDGSQSTNDTKLKVYIDGLNKSLSYVGTVPTSLPETSSNLVLGSYSNGGSHSHGVMDDVRVYNRALTANEVKLIYNETSDQKINVAPTNSNSGLNSGLVAHWTMDGKDTVWTSSTAGTVVDKSGNGNTGTLSNMSASEAPVIGKVGQGLRFDGADDFITFGSNFIGTNPLTICGWFYTRDVASGDVIIHNGETQIAFSTNNRFYFTSNNSNFPISAVGAIDGNVWQYICATRDASAITNLYVNGIQTGNADQNGSSVDAGGTVRLGSATNGSGDYQGIMDEIRIYNRVLSIFEIKQLYNQVN